MSIEQELEELKEFINEKDKVRVVPIVDYVCAFCGKTYGELERANDHVAECLRNVYDNHNCLTCKHSCYNLVPIYGKKNGYDELIKEGVTSNYGYFTCEKDKKQYEGKLGEELILRKDKQCYEPLEVGENFYVKRTKQYEKYMELVERIEEETKEIDNNIDEFYSIIDRLQKEGKDEQEIQDYLEEFYAEE